jgi:serpin B
MKRLTAGLLALALAASAWGNRADDEKQKTQKPQPDVYADGLPATKNADPADKAKLVEGNTEFALDLYRRLGGQEGNLFVSPYSVSTALAMTYAGAKGTSAEQMASVLKFHLKKSQLHPAFAGLIHDLHGQTREGGGQFSVANAVWRDGSVQLLSGYQKTVQANYGGVMKVADFRSNLEGTRRTINTWVEDKTNKRIKDLIPQGVLTPNSRMVLTNAIYFKNKWVLQFKKEASWEEPFILETGKKIKVMMMHQTNYFNYHDAGDFQVLQMPYEDRRTAMVILLPRKVDGLAGLEQKLTQPMLKDVLGKLRGSEVRVTLPKFKVTDEFRLKSTLAVMGMPVVFDPSTADFSGIDGGTNGLFIGDVLHKTFVEVDEAGTEAAAATAVILDKKNAAGKDPPPPPPEFRADHPFLFLIQDTRTGTVLFIGRLANPKQ